MSFELITYPDAEMMMIDLAGQIASELQSTLHHENRATLVVPGGTTPGPVFDELSAVDIGWERVTVILSDERCVPVENPRSNTRLIEERLITGKAAAARHVPLYRDGDDGLLATIAEVEGALPISVLLLGMGADMHTASLFSGAEALAAALAEDAPILLPISAPGVPEPRITFSAPVLNNAMSKHIVITGAEKFDALEKAKQAKVSAAPIRAVWDQAKIHWAAA